MHIISAWLLVIGGLNWGLAFFNFNLLTMLGTWLNQTWVAPFGYALIGLAALYELFCLLGWIKKQ